MMGLLSGNRMTRTRNQSIPVSCFRAGRMRGVPVEQNAAASSQPIGPLDGWQCVCLLAAQSDSKDYLGTHQSKSEWVAIGAIAFGPRTPRRSRLGFRSPAAVFEQLCSLECLRFAPQAARNRER